MSRAAERVAGAMPSREPCGARLAWSSPKSDAAARHASIAGTLLSVYRIDESVIAYFGPAKIGRFRSMLEAQLAAEDHAFARLIAAAAQLKPQHQEALRALEE